MVSEIFPGVFRFVHPPSANVYLLKGTSRNVLIDCGLQKHAPLLSQELVSRRIFPTDVSEIWFTHAHADHIGGAVLFPKSRKRMHALDGGMVNEKRGDFTYSPAFREEFFLFIDSFFEEGQILSCPPFSLKVIFSPGHTAGSVCFWDEQNGLLFSGDTLFKGTVGRWDLLSGNKSALRESVEKLSKLKFSLLLPGHGEVLKGKQEGNFGKAFLVLED
ncbi:MAG: MBL fold metallo-hydrolase [Candidatus Diapherotrites archaeon]|nr:MBL fold metallo-hydrolase [Candidatus Diapherotrites archaeon]